jgi:hypothetical protein
MHSNLQIAADVTVTNAIVVTARGENANTESGVVIVSVERERSANVGSVKSVSGGNASTVVGTERDGIGSSSNVIVSATVVMSKLKFISLRHYTWLILIQWSLPWILSTWFRRGTVSI